MVAGLVALGALALSPAAWAACTAPDGAAGALDYDPATKIRTICDGSAWKNLEEVDYSGDGARQRLQIADDAGSCTGAKLGRLRYDGVAEWQYCDGSDWQPFGSAADDSPDSFDFTDSVVAPGVTATSDIVLVSGFASAEVSITGAGSPEFRICSDAACSSEVETWGSSDQAIAPGHYLQLRLTAASTVSTARAATVTLGIGAADWTVTTGTPNVFVTSTTHSGSGVGGLSGADSKCAARASSAGLAGTWKAWLSTAAGTDPAGSRFSAGVTANGTGFFLPTGTKVADSWADLTDGSLDAAINVYENGTGASGEGNVWTSTDSSGSYNGYSGSGDCSDYSSTSGSSMFGLRTSTTATWTDSNPAPCSSSHRLYCFRQ